MPTKFHDPADILEHNRIDMALIQKTNLDLEDQPHKSLASTLCVGTVIAAAQDTTEVVV